MKEIFIEEDLFLDPDNDQIVYSAVSSKYNKLDSSCIDFKDLSTYYFFKRKLK
jgi:hypothetical protein